MRLFLLSLVMIREGKNSITMKALQSDGLSQEKVPPASGISRRDFIKITGTAALSMTLTEILSSKKAPAALKGGKLHILKTPSFAVGTDEELKRQVEEWGKQNRYQIILEMINGNDLQAKTAASIQNNTGPDIIEILHNWPHLYASGCVEVDELCEELGQKFGGFYDQIVGHCKVEGRWKAIPNVFINNAQTYRVDWFEEIGVKDFPDTWEEYHKVGKILKAKGRPFGQTFGHTYVDGYSIHYPYLWSFGAKEVEADGKTVALDSPETLQAVEMVIQLWKDCYDETGLSWDDTSNNRAFLAEQISCTLNAASIYVAAKKDNPELASKIRHAANPRGPAGRFHFHNTFEYAIMKYSKQVDAALDLIRWLMERENFSKWLSLGGGFYTAPTRAYENDPLWERDPIVLPYRDLAQYGRSPGYAGPPSRKASEVLSKYIITDMFAFAIQGLKSPRDAIKWATEELRQIYET